MVKSCFQEGLSEFIYTIDGHRHRKKNRLKMLDSAVEEDLINQRNCSELLEFGDINPPIVEESSPSSVSSTSIIKRSVDAYYKHLKRFSPAKNAQQFSSRTLKPLKLFKRGKDEVKWVYGNPWSMSEPRVLKTSKGKHFCSIGCEKCAAPGTGGKKTAATAREISEESPSTTESILLADESTTTKKKSKKAKLRARAKSRRVVWSDSLSPQAAANEVTAKSYFAKRNPLRPITSKGRRSSRISPLSVANTPDLVSVDVTSARPYSKFSKRRIRSGRLKPISKSDRVDILIIDHKNGSSSPELTELEDSGLEVKDLENKSSTSTEEDTANETTLVEDHKEKEGSPIAEDVDEKEDVDVNCNSNSNDDANDKPSDDLNKSNDNHKETQSDKRKNSNDVSEKTENINISDAAVADSIITESEIEDKTLRFMQEWYDKVIKRLKKEKNEKVISSENKSPTANSDPDDEREKDEARDEKVEDEETTRKTKSDSKPLSGMEDDPEPKSTSIKKSSAIVPIREHFSKLKRPTRLRKQNSKTSSSKVNVSKIASIADAIEKKFELVVIGNAIAIHEIDTNTFDEILKSSSIDDYLDIRGGFSAADQQQAKIIELSETPDESEDKVVAEKEDHNNDEERGSLKKSQLNLLKLWYERTRKARTSEGDGKVESFETTNQSKRSSESSIKSSKEINNDADDERDEKEYELPEIPPLSETSSKNSPVSEDRATYVVSRVMTPGDPTAEDGAGATNDDEPEETEEGPAVDDSDPEVEQVHLPSRDEIREEDEEEDSNLFEDSLEERRLKSADSFSRQLHFALKKIAIQRQLCGVKTNAKAIVLSSCPNLKRLYSAERIGGLESRRPRSGTAVSLLKREESDQFVRDMEISKEIARKIEGIRAELAQIDGDASEGPNDASEVGAGEDTGGDEATGDGREAEEQEQPDAPDVERSGSSTGRGLFVSYLQSIVERHKAATKGVETSDDLNLVPDTNFGGIDNVSNDGAGVFQFTSVQNHRKIAVARRRKRNNTKYPITTFVKDLNLEKDSSSNP